MKNKKILIPIEIAGAILLVVILFLIFGNNKKMTCNLTSDQSKSGYKLESKYEISAKNKIVKTVKITETITSSKKDILDKFEKQLKEQYEYNKN